MSTNDTTGTQSKNGLSSQRMENKGVITKIDERGWCAGIVVPKPNEVRICVDLTKLNKSVKRETHSPISRADIGSNWYCQVLF